MQLCGDCGQEMKLVPAGVSKSSGKPYKAFYSCPNCKTTMNVPQVEAPKPVARLINGAGNGSADMMRLAYRKDLMVALISKYGETLSNVELKSFFNDLWSEIEK